MFSKFSTDKELLALVAEESSLGIIITDTKGCVTWVNTKSEKMTGYNLDDFYGKAPGKVLQGENTDPVDVKRISEGLASREPFIADIKNYKKSGEEIWIELHITPVFDVLGQLTHYIGMQVDVTDYKKSKELILESEAKFKTVVASSPSAIIVRDRDGRFTDINAEAERILGIDASQLLGKFWFENEDIAVFDEEKNEKLIDRMDYLATLRTGVPPESSLELVINQKKNISRWVKNKTELIRDANDDVIGVISSFVDVTELKENEQRINENLKRIEDQRKRLENFNHIVSHNLGNQINNIHSLITLSGKVDDKEEWGSYMELLKSTSDRLVETLSHLKEIIAFDHLAGNLKLEKLPLHEYVEKILSSVYDQILTKGVIVDNQIPLDIKVNANPAYLESILLNLVTNAIKYRERSRQPTLKFYCKKKGDLLHIKCEDNGLGMDMSKVEGRIFNIFQTFHNNKDAMGVGLHITKNQVEAMGGQIAVASQVDVGSVFTVKLPAV